jgi:hypothetical protein
MIPLTEIKLTLSPHEVQDIVEALGVAMSHEPSELIVKDFRNARKAVQAARLKAIDDAQHAAVMSGSMRHGSPIK